MFQATLAAAILAALLSLFTLILICIRLKKTSGKENGDRFLRDLQTTRAELNSRLDSMQQALSTSVAAGITAGSNAQLNALTKLSQDIRDSLKSFEDRVNALSTTMEQRLSIMQTENQKKLDEMQGIVNEKLQTALEKRVSESFRLVSERLEQVYRGLGEMQTLASGVGDLKKILGNVKTRGIFGEIQLSRILEQMLSPEQYTENVVTIPGKTERVEFAVRLPGKDGESEVYLPIDSKFPLDIYQQFTDALESGDPIVTESCRRILRTAILKNAKDIKEKYLQPPHTTDFGIMFLPTEGLYAEVLNQTDLVERIMKDYSVTIAGPTTLSALLNSLQMGFRTLAIEKRSNEVWSVLGAVKSEFETFETVLDKVKGRLELAGDELDKLVGTRTRAIRRKLRQIEALPQEQAVQLLEDFPENDA